MSTNPSIAIDTLRQLLRYDPETGFLFWLPRDVQTFTSVRFGKTWNTRNAGRVAGRIDEITGYNKIMLQGIPRLGHRLAWAIHYGEYPSGTIDHINGIRCDNRLNNLRNVSHSANMRNIKKPITNTSGIVGVHWCKRDKNWRASIQVSRKTKYLGNYDRFEDAVAARKEAEQRYGFHPNHGR